MHKLLFKGKERKRDNGVEVKYGHKNEIEGAINGTKRTLAQSGVSSVLGVGLTVCLSKR